MKNFIFVFFILYSVNCFSYQLTSPLVSAKWLNNNLDKVVVLDIRKEKQDFAKGHIPGSVFVSSSSYRVDKTIKGKSLEGYLPIAKKFNSFAQQHGINNDSAVVILTKQFKYTNAKYATRLYWQFKAFGFNNVAVLDGGYLKWKKDIKKIEKGESVNRTGDFNTAKLHKDFVATTKDVKKAIKDKNIQLVDYRNFAYYLGTHTKSYVSYAGHIPTSIGIPENLFHNKDNTLISKEMIKSTFKALNVDFNKEIILYCNTANEASIAWLMLHDILKVKNVKLYDGSLIEWTALGLPTKSMVIENFN